MNRSIRLWSAFVGMVMIGNLQYAWTLFAQPMVKAHARQHWQLSDVQWGFGLFIAAGTWTMPFLASFIDTTSPRILMAFSGLLCAVGWGSLGHVGSLTLILLALRYGGGWRRMRVRMRSRNRREMVSRPARGRLGNHIAGYEMGAAAFNPLFNHLIRTIRYSDAFLWTGISHGALIVLAGLVLVNPPSNYKAAAAAPRSRRSGVITSTSLTRKCCARRSSISCFSRCCRWVSAA